MRKGTRHEEITIVSEPEDGFPYFSANCACGWKSVLYHAESGAWSERDQHRRGATGPWTPKEGKS